MFVVYVIKSRSTNRTYTGQTDDLEKRIGQHNNPEFSKRSFTSLNGNRDWEVVYKEDYQTRSKAIRRERQLKSANGRSFIHSMIMGR